MEVLTSVPATDFNFESGCSTPFLSAPSSPKLVGEIYFSAPTSPTRSASLYRDFNNISFVHRSSTSCDGSPFVWDEEEEVLTEKRISIDTHISDQEDFAFDFSGQLEKTPLSADELFHGGKIRPLKSLPSTTVSSPRKQKKKETEDERGRQRVSVSSSNPKHRSTRSLSPLRLSDYVFEEEVEEQSTETTSSISKTSYSFFTKWKLKDLLLFRSASEGRAANKDPLKKYSGLSRKQGDLKICSFRSTDSSGSFSSARRKGPVSAHELHYASKKAVQEELKRKTFLPYKKGLLGCVGFNPTVNGFVRGLNSIKRG